MSDIDSTHDYGEFAPTPETGDMRTLSDMVKRAGEVAAGIKKLEQRIKDGKNLLKDLTHKQIPEFLTDNCGGVERIDIAGYTVELKPLTYGGIPSESAIEKEKDDDVKAEMIARRAAAIEILEEKAPALLKRFYGVEFDRDEEDKAEEFEAALKDIPGAPKFEKSVTVHPKTLAKWYNEIKADGGNLTLEERQILGISTMMVAKIST